MDRYHLLQELGQGSHGKTFVAVCKGRYVAMKIVCSEDLVDAAEAYVMTHIGAHPGIANLLDAWLSPYWVALAMDLAGQSIWSFLLAVCPPVEEFFLEMCSQLGAGLAHIHLQEILHRDIHLKNMCVQEQAGGYSFRLIDFGMARHCPGTRADPVAVLSLSGKVLPKESRPPEIWFAPKTSFHENNWIAARSARYGMALDIWAFAVALLDAHTVHEGAGFFFGGENEKTSAKVILSFLGAPETSLPPAQIAQIRKLAQELSDAPKQSHHRNARLEKIKQFAPNLSEAVGQLITRSLVWSPSARPLANEFVLS